MTSVMMAINRSACCQRQQQEGKSQNPGRYGRLFRWKARETGEETSSLAENKHFLQKEKRSGDHIICDMSFLAPFRSRLPPKQKKASYAYADLWGVNFPSSSQWARWVLVNCPCLQSLLTNVRAGSTDKAGTGEAE